ncbi:hypothetical protein Q7C36_003115 [Tachysurus vachellii]|uniref:TMEM205-like domain-containing protein n=1 Tax=Tachysurus vachellii TaxID=175792 RepID=A0AA88NR73_TACVA|nr:hypothetical protein Q7C36_003115 [Tachysurus vachellii]
MQNRPHAICHLEHVVTFCHAQLSKLHRHCQGRAVIGGDSKESVTVWVKTANWSFSNQEGEQDRRYSTYEIGGCLLIMSTDPEPSLFVKLFHLVFLSTFWGMQIWVTFISGFVMDSHLNRHTYGFIQSRLFPYYLHIGSACAFFNLTIFAMYHPSDLMDDKEAFQIFVFFVCVTVAAVNAQWFGQLTSEIMADMHMIEQACGLGQDIGLSSNREAYSKLCDKDPKKPYNPLIGSQVFYSDHVPQNKPCLFTTQVMQVVQVTQPHSQLNILLYTHLKQQQHSAVHHRNGIRVSL